MIQNTTIINHFKVENLLDLNKMKDLEKYSGIKINKSRIARELGVSRKTVLKYYNGFIPSNQRNKSSSFNQYEEIIDSLLYSNTKSFQYIKNLFDYLTFNYPIQKSYSAFRKYISNHPKFKHYFNTKSAIKPTVRFETSAGQQAQLDWKENIRSIDKYGVEYRINILVVLLGYSRYRYYGVTFSKSQDVLLHHLTKAFQYFEGVPKTLLVDNMKTMMDEARNYQNKGKINIKMEQYAQDFGFKILPCMANRPQTKGKVESQMKVFEIIHAYQNEMTIEELVKFIEKINNIENTRMHKSYGKVPIISVEKEKAHLLPLPKERIQRAYLINEIPVKVNYSSMVSYKGNQYSVPKEYISKTVQLIVIDTRIHIYFNTKLIAVHNISTRKINYHEPQIRSFLSHRFIHKKENIIFIGSCGVGKTHLATSIGISAAKSRIPTYFIKCHDLVLQLKKAHLENRLEDRLRHFTKYRLLIIDEFGYLPLKDDEAKLLFQLIDRRYEKRSTIITTNISFSKWDAILNDPLIANAIIDRLLHHCHVVKIMGQSYRLKNIIEGEK